MRRVSVGRSNRVGELLDEAHARCLQDVRVRGGKRGRNLLRMEDFSNISFELIQQLLMTASRRTVFGWGLDFIGSMTSA